MIDSQLQKEAIDWFVRLRADDVSESDRTAFQAWLNHSPERRSAYDQVKLRWQQMDAVEARDVTESGSRDKTPAAGGRGRLPQWGLSIAALLGAVTISILLMLDSGQTYRSEVGEQRRVLLDDGSNIHLNTDTQVRVLMSSTRREIVLEKGEVLSDVAHAPERPFVVIAGDTEVIALGTRFSVHYKPNNTRVTVVEGLVSVKTSKATPSDSPRQTVLKSGQRLDIAIQSQSTLPRIGEVEAAAPIAWDQGLLVFDGVPLDEAVSEIDRYFPGELRVGSDVPANKAVTGTFKLRDRNVLLQTLSQSHGLTIVDVNGITLLVSQAEDLQ